MTHTNHKTSRTANTEGLPKSIIDAYPHKKIMKYTLIALASATVITLVAYLTRNTSLDENYTKHNNPNVHVADTSKKGLSDTVNSLYDTSLQNKSFEPNAHYNSTQNIGNVVYKHDGRSIPVGAKN